MDYQTLNLLFKCNKEFSHGKIRLQQMSDTECMICSYVYSNENCSQDDIAAALKTDKTTVGKALSSLENKNYVLRAKDAADKRINRVCLTATGRKKTSKLLNLHNNWLSEILTCLTAEEQKNFENYCKRLLSAAEKLQTQGENKK